MPATAAPLNVLIAIHGSAGDVYPGIAIGKALLQRGHRVLMATNPYFENAVAQSGIEFAAVGSAEEGLAAIENSDLWKRGKGLQVLFDGVSKATPEYYRIIADQHQPGKTVLVANVLAMGARIANEKLGIPLATIHLQPLLLRSLDEPPGVTVPDAWKPVLRPLRRMLQAAADRWLLDPAICPRLNSFRAELGLPPEARVLKTWIHSPQLVIGMFPDWFGAPQPDWPRNVHLVGFPLFDTAEATELPADVVQFLNAGTPPVVFTLGTAMVFAKEFFTVSAAVCERLGRRGMLLTKFTEQVPEGLPDSVRHFSYAPFSALLPRAAALVHHGGIGTMSQALAAGIPQLVTPFNFDQPDNAERLRRLGAGDTVRPRRYRIKTVAEKLERLLDSPERAKRCRDLAAELKNSDAIAKASRLVESLVTSADRRHVA